jgi:hypothetical protein
MRDFKLRRRFNAFVKDGGGNGNIVIFPIEDESSPKKGSLNRKTVSYNTIKNAYDAGKTIFFERAETTDFSATVERSVSFGFGYIEEEGYMLGVTMFDAAGIAESLNFVSHSPDDPMTQS